MSSHNPGHIERDSRWKFLPRPILLCEYVQVGNCAGNFQHGKYADKNFVALD